MIHHRRAGRGSPVVLGAENRISAELLISGHSLKLLDCQDFYIDLEAQWICSPFRKSPSGKPNFLSSVNCDHFCDQKRREWKGKNGNVWTEWNATRPRYCSLNWGNHCNSELCEKWPFVTLNQRAVGSTPTRPTKPHFVRAGDYSGEASLHCAGG
jgi:hypothetical protein